MQSEIFLNGKKYISTKKATEIIELDEEHIKDLCREEKIDFTKVEGEYFVELETLFEYKNKTNKPMILPIRALSTAVLAILLIGAGYFAGDIVKQVGEAGDTIFSVIKNTKEITYKVGAEKRDLFKTQILDNSDDSPIKEIKDSKNVKTIDTYTQDFLNYLEGLRNRIVSDSSSLRGTKQSINNLALAVYETASPVEQFAIVWYRTVNSVFARSVGNRSDEAIQNEDDVDRFTIVREDEVSQSETSSDSSDSSVIARNEAIQNSTTPLETTTVSDSLSLTGQVKEIIKETVVERVIQTSGITLEDLQKLNNELRSEIYKLSSNTNSQITNTYQVISATNNIDNLGSVTIYDSNITNTNISGTTSNFTNSTVDTLTVTGTSNLTGSLTGTTATFSGNLSTAGQLSITGTATSTASGDFAFDTNTLYIDSINNRVGVGTSTPTDTLSINGATYLAPISAPAVTTDRLYNISNDLYWGGNLVSGSAVGVWASNGTDVWRASGNVGIGTSSPASAYKLSVQGDTYIKGNLRVNGNTTISDSGELTVGDKVISEGEIGVG
ncbi:MAG: hypothetical protein PHX25_02865, partial [Candidatus Pacebacteria bacterium]|nr:hypothetical protein [Candidatus Paceibacterota bacterium]